MPAPIPSSSALTVLLVQQPPAVPSPAEVMTMTVELPPGDPGPPPQGSPHQSDNTSPKVGRPAVDHPALREPSKHVLSRQHVA